MSKQTDTYVKVLFVGDRPSVQNLSANRAFIGSRSGTVLMQWLEKLEISVDNYMAINRTDEFFIDCAKSFANQSKPVVSLGNNAHKALLKAGIFHYRLPHPSGLNRKNNDKKTVEALLTRCKRYIDTLEAFRQED
jgi:uracil-DNA glycosylase